MKRCLAFFIILLLIVSITSCKQKEKNSDMNIIFLHHSTGEVIWKGFNTKPSVFTRILRKISPSSKNIIGKKAKLPFLFENYNQEYHKNYLIKEIEFPKASPYGWSNYPYDYYNIWVKNSGDSPFKEEPTLEILTKQYQVIIFKHCFPVMNIKADQESADIDSDYKSLANYKLQYESIKNKLHKFPNTKFILFTGAALVKASGVSEDAALRAKEFFKWVIDEWDLPDDNIFIWDLYSLQTEGGLYFKNEYSVSITDSHPNTEFAEMTVQLLFNRIIDVIENNGTRTKLTGEKLH